MMGLISFVFFAPPAFAQVPIPVPRPVALPPPPPLPLDTSPAKQLFGAARLPANLQSRSLGFYAKGCLAGARPLPINGPDWQVMRLSRNRNWGHPVLINLLEKLAKKVQLETTWPGLLVGDMSQPRGGPMITGHASHQVGLDADVWLNPMPNRVLTAREREETSAKSMANAKFSGVNPQTWTPEHIKVIRLAAKMPGVERIFVNPVIKKQLCVEATGDRSWLGKVRPYWGHDYHMHIRMACPPGSPTCKAQAAPSGEEECGAQLDYWLKQVRKPDVPPPPKPPGPKKPPPPPMKLSDLPPECRVVLQAPDAAMAVTKAATGVVTAPDPEDQAATPEPMGQDTPVPPTPQ